MTYTARYRELAVTLLYLVGRTWVTEQRGVEQDKRTIDTKMYGREGTGHSITSPIGLYLTAASNEPLLRLGSVLEEGHYTSRYLQHHDLRREKRRTNPISFFIVNESLLSCSAAGKKVRTNVDC